MKSTKEMEDWMNNTAINLNKVKEEKEDDGDMVRALLLGDNVKIFGCSSSNEEFSSNEKYPTLVFVVDLDEGQKILQISFKTARAMMTFYEAVANMNCAMMYPDQTEEKTRNILG